MGSCVSNSAGIYGMWEYVGSQSDLSDSIMGGFGHSKEKYWNISETEISVYSDVHMYQGAMEFTRKGDTLLMGMNTKWLFLESSDTLRVKMVLPTEDNTWRVFKR